MFDAIDMVTSTVAITSAIYRVHLLLFERRRNRQVSETSDDEDQLASALIAEIEEVESKDIEKLSDIEVEQYTRLLAEILEKRLKAEVQYDESKGRLALERLRREYSSPNGSISR